MRLLIPEKNILQRRRYEKVLLPQTQLLARRDVIVRIENFRNRLRLVFVLDRPHVIAVIEIVEVEVARRFCGPEPQSVGRGVRVSRDGSIIRHGHHVFCLNPFASSRLMLVHKLRHPAIELDRVKPLGPRNFPHIAVPEPVVRRLDLDALPDVLEKDPIFIADAVAVSRELHRRHGIEKAGSQTPQPAVSKGSVPFHLSQILEPNPKLAERLGGFVEQLQIDQMISQHAPQQKFQGQIIDPLGIDVIVVLLGAQPTLNQPVPDGKAEATVLPQPCHRILVLAQRI